MKHLAVILGLAVSCLVISVANLLISRYFEINLLTFTVWFIVPVGSLACGMVAASGGILAAYLTNHRPKIADAISMIVFAAATMLLIYYLDYRTLVIDAEGTKASEAVSFSKYVEIVTTTAKHQTSFRGRAVGNAYEAGELGYLYLLLYFGGFIGGGFSAYLSLRDARHCPKCDAYLRTLKEKDTPPMDLTEIQAIHLTLKNGMIEDAVNALKWRPVKRKFDQQVHKFKMTQKVETCPVCNMQLLDCSISTFADNKEWIPLAEFGIYRQLSDGLSLRGVIPDKDFSLTVDPLPNPIASDTQEQSENVRSDS